LLIVIGADEAPIKWSPGVVVPVPAVLDSLMNQLPVHRANATLLAKTLSVTDYVCLSFAAEPKDIGALGTFPFQTGRQSIELGRS
jgi:hypothetical protein